MSQLWHDSAKTVRKLLKNGGRACKPDCQGQFFAFNAKDPLDLMKFLEQHDLKAYVDGGGPSTGCWVSKRAHTGTSTSFGTGLWGSVEGWHLHRKRIL